jgi:hypothetical protein
VIAFASAFIAAPMFVTSQEAGESPFKLWRLPRTITEHIDQMFDLYLGAAKGKELSERLRNSHLYEQLRSGYDVRSPAATKKLSELEKQGDKTEKSVQKISGAQGHNAQRRGLMCVVSSFLAVIGGTMAIKAFVADFIYANA